MAFVATVLCCGEMCYEGLMLLVYIFVNTPCYYSSFQNSFLFPIINRTVTIICLSNIVHTLTVANIIPNRLKRSLEFYRCIIIYFLYPNSS